MYAMGISMLICDLKVNFVNYPQTIFISANIGLEEYLDAADQLSTKFGLSREILLATDDQNLIIDLKSNQGLRRNFTFYFSDYGRQKGAMSAVEFAAKNDARLHIVISTIAELMLCSHPNVGGYVFTTKSNIGRIINELRKTDGKRSNYPYIDLEFGEFR